MCFGGTQKEQSTTQQRIPGWVQEAGKKNYAEAEQIGSQEFVPYEQPRVAPLTGNQQAAVQNISDLAGSSNPYTAQTEGYINAYGSAPATTINMPGAAPTADAYGVFSDIDGLASFSQYMDPYIQDVLNQALRGIEERGQTERLGLDRDATFSHAFGDARHGVVEGLQRKDQRALEADTTMRGLSQAFNTAAGLRGTDVNRFYDANKFNAGMKYNYDTMGMDAEKFNANAMEQYLQRMLNSGNALTDLDKYNVSRASDLNSLLMQAGEAERSIDQAQLDAAFQEFGREQNQPVENLNLKIAALSNTPYNKTSTTTTTSPDNSGWGILGSLGAAALKSPLLLSDERYKENIAKIGELNDRTPVYSFTYKGDPTPRMGLMAQDVEKHTPDAVVDFGSFKMVDYGKATERARSVPGLY